MRVYRGVLRHASFADISQDGRDPEPQWITGWHPSNTPGTEGAYTAGTALEAGGKQVPSGAYRQSYGVG